MLAAALLALAAAHAACPTRPGEVLELLGGVETGGLTGKLARRVEAATGRSFEVHDLGIVVTRTGFDGRLAWSQDGSGGVHDLNSAFGRRLAASMAWLDGRVGCSPSQRDGITRLGVRTEGKRRFYAWKAGPPGGVPFELWYDLRGGRLDRPFFQMAETRLIRHFADWRSVGGRLVPFLQRDEFPEDEDEVVRRITHATIRKTAGPADFVRPRPPSDARILGHVAFTTVPFEDDHRTRIYLPVTLNGKGPFLFELDNGGHNILTSETAAALGLQKTGSFNATGAGTAVAQSGTARVTRVQIGNAVVTDQPFSVREFSSASNDRSPNPPRGLTTELNKGVARGATKVTHGSVGVGPFDLNDELVSYYGPAERGSEYSRAVAGIYGEPLLSRFKSTYDYSGGVVWLEPLPEVKPQPFDRSGLSLAKAEGGALKVASVAGGSPAQKAGIAKDDLIGAIQGIPSTKLSRADAAAIFRGEPLMAVMLTGTFGGAQGLKQLTLAELISR